MMRPWQHWESVWIGKWRSHPILKFSIIDQVEANFLDDDGIYCTLFCSDAYYENNSNFIMTCPLAQLEPY